MYSEILPWDIGDEAVREFAPAGVVLSGGPLSVTAGRTPRAPQSVFDLGKPVLGICYGMQTIAHQLGGSVELAEPLRVRSGRSARDVRERIAVRTVRRAAGSMDEPRRPRKRLAAGFEGIGESDNAPLAAIADPDRRMFGVQFHPRSHPTPASASK